MNEPDYLLYKHFNESFWQKINEIGIEKIESKAQLIENHYLNATIDFDSNMGSNCYRDPKIGLLKCK